MNNASHHSTTAALEQADNTATLLAEGLDEVAEVLQDNLDLADTARKLRARAEKVRADRFKVLVVGEFSRGKSTLLNAMLGDDVMPRKAAECTAVVTIIRYGERPHVRVLFNDGRPPKEDLSVEEFQSQYELKVEDAGERQAALDRFSIVDHAELYYPVEVCRHHVELVDSPGLAAHKTRAERTQKFLHQADAVIFVLHAKMFLTENESHFLESILLPMGLRNIFFVINWYNLMELDTPKAVARDKAELEASIHRRLTPFCVLDGVDRSEERIFRVNAFDAMNARMSETVDEVMLAKSTVPAFERSLQQFLVQDRARARNDVTLGLLQTTVNEVNRFIAAQEELAGKSLAEIEAEAVALKPKLDRLRGIKSHIEGFLDSQSANLQDRLTISFQQHVRKIHERVPEAAEQFDLRSVTRKFLTYEGIADKFRSEENSFKKKLQDVLVPQVTTFLEREFAIWQTSVVRNELKAVSLDVEKHLQEEADEYRRVLRDIEERLGLGGKELQIDDLVKRWLGGGSTSQGSGGVTLPNVDGPMMGDMTAIIASIVVEVSADIAHNAVAHTALAWLGWVGLAFTAGRIIWRELNIRTQLSEKIVQGIRDKLHELEHTHAAKIREGIKKDFEGLKEKVVGSINEEIALIDASLQTILDRKRQGELRADQERQRLEQARVRIASTLQRLQAAV